MRRDPVRVLVGAGILGSLMLAPSIPIRLAAWAMLAIGATFLLPSGRQRIVATSLTIVLLGGVTFHCLRTSSREQKSHGGSCGNHTGLHKMDIALYQQNWPKGAWPRIEDAMEALTEVGVRLGWAPVERRDWLDGGGGDCTYSEGVGFRWVGAGLPVKLAQEKRALLFFCPAANRIAVEHVHAMTGGDPRTCTDNAGMIKILEAEIARGEKREVPYTSNALQVMRQELAARREIERHRTWLWVPRWIWP